ncbi:MAG: hypothetical protein MJ229_01745 [bacterium]|nr:hypothetical protein [bacterium]
MDNNEKLANVIDALSKHEDNSAVAVLEEIGTNCADSEVRMLTAKALVERNSKDSLSVIISRDGKGINDLDTTVAMGTINNLIALENKDLALEILSETEKNCEIESVKDNARSVKALLELS